MHAQKLSLLICVMELLWEQQFQIRMIVNIYVYICFCYFIYDYTKDILSVSFQLSVKKTFSMLLNVFVSFVNDDFCFSHDV